MKVLLIPTCDLECDDAHELRCAVVDDLSSSVLSGSIVRGNGRIAGSKGSKIIGRFHACNGVIEFEIDGAAGTSSELLVIGVNGPGPWRVSKTFGEMSTVDWKPVGKDTFVFDEKQYLERYGLLRRDKEGHHFQAALDELFKLSNETRVQSLVGKENRGEGFIAPVMRLTGGLLVYISDLPIPNLVFSLVRFVLMAKRQNRSADPACSLRQVFFSFNVMHCRGTQLETLFSASDSDNMRHRKKHIQYAFTIDLVLGCLVGLILVLYGKELGDMLYDTVGFLLRSDAMESRVQWILSAHAPLGFKLNERLDQVCGGTILAIVQGWHNFTAVLAPYSPNLLLFVGVLCAVGGGFSLILAFGCDAIHFLTFHVQFLYGFFSSLHRFQLSALSTFSNVVRGRKQNILRNRVDTGDFDTSELLLGSVSFIAVGFLFQTTLTYYVLFTGIWVANLTVVSLFWTALRLLHSVPIHTMVWIGLNKTCLPIGVTFGPGGEYTNLCLTGEYTTKRLIVGSWLSKAPEYLHECLTTDAVSLVSALKSGDRIKIDPSLALV
mmetsp:Transcript_26112/g.42195  ORF Transcript_26112/g.42195 Transcript_26112/m.42195 type:complete len:549 (-) Transcript_26112:1491-3137(-)